MTIDEKKALYDRILKTAGLQNVRSGENSVSFSSDAEKVKFLDRLAAEIVSEDPAWTGAGSVVRATRLIFGGGLL